MVQNIIKRIGEAGVIVIQQSFNNQLVQFAGNDFETTQRLLEQLHAVLPNMEKLFFNRGIRVENDGHNIHIRIASKAVQTTDTLLKCICVPRHIKMDDLGCILEVTTLTTGFIADDYTALGIILESVHAVFQFFALHVLSESYGVNTHI